MVLLLLAALALVAALLAAQRAPRLWLAATGVATTAAGAAAIGVLARGTVWEWDSGWVLGGAPLTLRLDAISALFLVLVATVGGAGAAYAHEYWSDRAHPRSARAGRVWWSVLLASLGLVLLAANGLHFLIAWELFTLGAYFLITLDRRRRDVRAAGWVYLCASHAASLSLFAFFALLAARTGSWELGPVREQPELAPLFWLALFGFGVKAGLFPLHVWLPSAHANAPSHVSAIMSGVTIKLGIYGLVRFSGWLPVPAGAAWVVVALGVTSAVAGVAFALGQHDLKRLLAYHSVENIGIILVGLGFALGAAQLGHAAWGRLALAGGLLHVWNHGLFKSLLFLGAGSVLRATHTRVMSRLGGLWRTLPWTAGLFGLGAVAICGLPPLNGFVSEWLVYLGLFAALESRETAALAAVPAVVLLGLTGALALACFIKVCAVVFLGAPRTAAARAPGVQECGPWMRGPMLVLGALCVAIGLAPGACWPVLARAVAEWNPAWSDPAPPVALATLGATHLALVLGALAAATLVMRRMRRNGQRRALTWDCGFVAPTARMQYTAGSFASTITEWFAWILRPRRHEHRPSEPFPSSASFEEHTPETVLERVIEPAGGAVMRLSDAARRLQHGRLQAYLLYLVVGIAVLAVLAALGDGR
jgi:hydrogenase-4 component B